MASSQAAAAAEGLLVDEREEWEEEAWAWSWGAGTDGQLGTGGFQDHHLPQPLLLPPRCRRRVSCVAGGGAHAIALTNDGEVFTWGRGTHGQLGHGNMENCPHPTLVKFFVNYTVTCVSSGWNHSGFATDNGQLFLCGDGSFGQLGTGDNQSRNLPSEVAFFTKKHVEKLAFGMRHSLVLLKDNSVYGFGSARHGQVGKFVSRTQKSCNVPRLVDDFTNCKIVNIYANGDHSAALDESGQFYIWGRALIGEHDDDQPWAVAPFMRISQAALGWHHALVLSVGEVYTIGAYRHQKLNLSESANPVAQQSNPTTSSIFRDESSLLPTLEKVPCIDAEWVLQIAAGTEHSAFLTDKGTVFTWGWGEHGQLGLGNTIDQTIPQRVNICDKRSSSSASLGVYCGSGFTVVVELP